MIYVASPYTHPNPDIMIGRYRKAQAVTAQLIARGEHAFSPIAHCHELAALAELPTDFDFWQAYNFAFLRLSLAMYIITMDGWRDSIGVSQEREMAHKLHIPVYFINERGLKEFKEPA